MGRRKEHWKCYPIIEIDLRKGGPQKKDRLGQGIAHAAGVG